MRDHDRRRMIRTIFGAKRLLPKRAVVGYCNNPMHKGFVTDRELKSGHDCLHCGKNGKKCPYLAKNHLYEPLKEETR